MARTPEELVGGLASGAGGGDGGSGVWLGPTRWILPAHSDTAHNLLTVTLDSEESFVLPPATGLHHLMRWCLM